MKGSKATLSSFAEKCKTILASNWQGKLSTVKADAEGSKGGIHSSRVKYFIKRGKPYIWVPEKDLHNVNTIIDERSSLAVASPYPGSLMKVLHSIKKLPARVALVGDIVPLGEKKVISAEESLSQSLFAEQESIKEFSHSVSGILSTSNLGSTSRSQNLQDLLVSNDSYMVYKFDIRIQHIPKITYPLNGKIIVPCPMTCCIHASYFLRKSSCTYIDSSGSSHEVEVEHMNATMADPLSPFSMSLVDGINQSEARRRALIFFCIAYLNKKVKDALMLSVDRKGFDVLGKILGPLMNDGSRQYVWNEFRFTFKESAIDIENFCQQLVVMEEEALKNVSNFSGV